MRVTKVIREYVEREVGKKFEPAFKAAEEIGNPAVKEVRDAINKMVGEANAKAIEMAKAAGVFCNKHYSHTVETPDLICTGTYIGHHIRDEAADAERNKRFMELREKKEKAIEDILLSLELGEATKDELRGLIEKVTV